MVLRNFVVLEGGDGTGTSTQLALLEEAFRTRAPGLSVHRTFEPTGGPVGELVRSALRREIDVLPSTIARLFAADRAEHLWRPGGVAERCGRGELVVCDRYVPSSLVYQGIECGDELPARLNAEFPLPELVLYFDLDPRIAVERFSGREVKDVYERLDFQVLVRERYARILPAYAEAGCRVARVDASASIAEVAERVWREIEALPILKG